MNQMSLKPAIAQTNPILVNIQHPRFSGPKYVFSTLLNHDFYWFLKKWVSIAEAILFIARSPPISLAGASISRGSTLWSTTICPMRVTGPKAAARWGSRNSWNSWVIYRLKFECIKLFFCATLWWFLYIFSLKKMKPFRRSPFTGASFIIIILVSSLSKPRREQPKMAPNVHCLDSRAMLCQSASTKHHNRAGHVFMADWPLLVPGFPIFCTTTPVGQNLASFFAWQFHWRNTELPDAW